MSYIVTGWGLPGWKTLGQGLECKVVIREALGVSPCDKEANDAGLGRGRTLVENIFG